VRVKRAGPARVPNSNKNVKKKYTGIKYELLTKYFQINVIFYKYDLCYNIFQLNGQFCNIIIQ
jgi:hypothetical protein